MKQIRIAVLGAAGRLGGEIVRLALADPRFSLSAALVSDGSARLGTLVPGSALGFQSAQSAFDCDVLIDAAGAAGFDVMRGLARLQTSAVVCASTGLTFKQMQQLEALSANRAVFYSANLSVGAAVLRQLATLAATLLDSDWDCEISEVHHRDKRDAPSGTAMMLADAVETARASAQPRALGRSGPQALRLPGEVGVHALRGGSVVGDHAVHFFGNAERIVLQHHAESRELFARGALRAARWIVSQPNGFKSMDDLLRD